MISSMQILLTGHRGKLGTELQKLKDFTLLRGDITRLSETQPCDLLIHAAAYTNVAGAEQAPTICFETNVLGTFNLVNRYKNVPFVYISTEYAHNPIGIYAWTKKWAEEIVKSHPRHLIIRTLFKPNPWSLDVAYEDQYTQGDYIDVIAPLILSTIAGWDRETSKSIYCGTGRKTMYELAKRTKPDVIPNKVINSFIPKDYQ